MIIRKGTEKDLKTIAAIYDRIHTEEEAGRTHIGWVRAIYPTPKTAAETLAAGTLFVGEENGKVVAAAKIDQEQMDSYAMASWQYPAEPEEILVLHTLVVDPLEKGQGYGTQFVRFYEEYALQKGCPYLRMDTNQRNTPARTLYNKLGYAEVGIVPCTFNGIEGVQLVCLEKKLK